MIDFETIYMHSSIQGIHVFGASRQESTGRKFYSFNPLCILTILTIPYGIGKRSFVSCFSFFKNRGGWRGQGRRLASYFADDDMEDACDEITMGREGRGGTHPGR